MTSDNCATSEVQQPQWSAVTSSAGCSAAAGAFHSADSWHSLTLISGASLHKLVSLLNPTMTCGETTNTFGGRSGRAAVLCYISAWLHSPSTLLQDITADINSTNCTVMFFFILLEFLDNISGLKPPLLWRRWRTRSADSAYRDCVLFIVGRSDIMEHSVEQGDTWTACKPTPPCSSRTAHCLMFHRNWNMNHSACTNTEYFCVGPKVEEISVHLAVSVMMKSISKNCSSSWSTFVP